MTTAVTDPTTMAALENTQRSAGVTLLRDLLNLSSVEAGILMRSLGSAGEPPHLGNNVDARA
ncbi:MAG: putative motility protein [bacterium]|nr:putative motility protein [bacterium]